MKHPRLLALLAATPLLGGCALLPLLPNLGPTLEPGSCLAASDGPDSNLHSVVDCTQPHRYDVVALGSWSGMADALANADPDDVYDSLQTEDSGFTKWVRPWCSTAVRAAVGWSNVDLGLETPDGQSLTTDQIWAEPAGSFYIDISLPTKPDFVAGEHRVACSAAWVDETGRQADLAFPQGLGFSDLFEPGLPIATRSCVSVDAEPIICGSAEGGAGAVFDRFASFDAVAALGPDLVIALATSDNEGAALPALEKYDTVCSALAAAVPHSPQTGAPVSTILDENGDWDRVARTGVLEDGVRYFVNCFAMTGATA